MTSVVSEAIMGVSAIVVAALLATVVLSGFVQIGDASSLLVSGIKERLNLGIKVIAGYVGNDYIKLWVKNVGRSSIDPGRLLRFDVIVNYAGQYMVHVPHVSSNPSPPYWNYTILNDYVNKGFWDPGETLEIVIQWSGALSSGDYVVTIFTHLGTSDSISLAK